MPLNFWDRCLEKFGRLFFAQMRPFFFFILMVIPLFAAAAFLFLQNNRIQEIEERFAAASTKGKAAFERKAKKEAFLHRYLNADPYFLDQKIESLLFLQNERKQIESWLRHPALPRKESLVERLSFLTEGANRLVFAEENIRTSGRIQETDEKQRHPVQMHENDLQKLLSLIEDIPVGPYLPPNGAPQLLVRDFRLKKIKTHLHTEIFEVEMDLVKREFSPP